MFPEASGEAANIFFKKLNVIKQNNTAAMKASVRMKDKASLERGDADIDETITLT